MARPSSPGWMFHSLIPAWLDRLPWIRFQTQLALGVPDVGVKEQLQ